MEQLKKNGFWVGLAVVAALIVGAFVYFVIGEWDARTKAADSLKRVNEKLKEALAKPAEIPSDKQIIALQDRTKELQTDVEKCKSWYKTYDDELEKWFAALPDPPAVGAFKAQYDTLREKMKTDLEGGGIHVGVRPAGDGAALLTAGPVAGGLHWEEVGAPSSPSIKEIQKRFWIRQRVADTLLQLQQEAPKSVVALEEIRFAPGPRGTSGEDYPGWPSNAFELPGKYGLVMTCGIRVEMSNALVPKFLKMLLETDAPGPKLLTHIRGSRVTLVEALPDKIEEVIRVPAGENAQEAKQKRTDELKKEWTAPRPVRVFVTYEIFDFDGEKLSKPFVPATAAAL